MLTKWPGEQGTFWEEQTARAKLWLTGTKEHGRFGRKSH